MQPDDLMSILCSQANASGDAAGIIPVVCLPHRNNALPGVAISGCALSGDAF